MVLFVYTYFVAVTIGLSSFSDRRGISAGMAKAKAPDMKGLGFRVPPGRERGAEEVEILPPLSGARITSQSCSIQHCRKKVPKPFFIFIMKLFFANAASVSS